MRSVSLPAPGIGDTLDRLRSRDRLRDLELSAKRGIMAASDRVVLVAATSKMGYNDLVRLGSFRDIDVLVTDRKPPRSPPRSPRRTCR
ncbi:hypothetical protein [Paramicrobacterium humi]|uniref:hypothetical protein n=1 Tax=Paramicrobacterium humi TaxID=640635 RepID=UPI002482104C|nr:hypothetical protein [Microbacterium humi]